MNIKKYLSGLLCLLLVPGLIHAMQVTTGPLTEKDFENENAPSYRTDTDTHSETMLLAHKKNEHDNSITFHVADLVSFIKKSYTLNLNDLGLKNTDLMAPLKVMSTDGKSFVVHLYTWKEPKIGLTIFQSLQSDNTTRYSSIFSSGCYPVSYNNKWYLHDSDTIRHWDIVSPEIAMLKDVTDQKIIDEINKIPTGYFNEGNQLHRSFERLCEFIAKMKQAITDHRRANPNQQIQGNPTRTNFAQAHFVTFKDHPNHPSQHIPKQGPWDNCYIPKQDTDNQLNKNTQAMEEANAIFKKMTKISMDLTQPHGGRYSAHSSTGKILHAHLLNKTNDFLIEIEDEQGLKTSLHNRMNKNEPARIFNFLKSIWEKKQKERNGLTEPYCIKGSDLVDPQEMPKDEPPFIVPDTNKNKLDTPNNTPKTPTTNNNTPKPTSNTPSSFLQSPLAKVLGVTALGTGVIGLIAFGYVLYKKFKAPKTKPKKFPRRTKTIN